MAVGTETRHNPRVATRSKGTVSIEDVAHAASVSTATVSRVLNNPGLVAPETAARVQKAIIELDYRPNLFAKGLSTRRSHVLGIALPDLFGEFYSELLRGADTEARRAGYHLLVSGEGRIADGGGPDNGLIFGLVDGLAVMITEPTQPVWDELTRTTLPVVVLDADVRGRGVSGIVVDNEAGTVEATEHLLESVPPARCYFVGGPEKNFDSAARARAFGDVLEQRGHRVRPDQVSFGAFTLECGQQWARQRLAKATADGPIGVLTGNDEIAYGVMQVAQQAGLGIPERVRLVGFDDSRLASLVRPRLSSVRIPAAEIGAAAVRLLVERIADPEGPATQVRLVSTLVARESSVAPIA